MLLYFAVKWQFVKLQISDRQTELRSLFMRRFQLTFSQMQCNNFFSAKVKGPLKDLLRTYIISNWTDCRSLILWESM